MGGLIAPVVTGALGAGVGSLISPNAAAGLGLAGAGAGLGLSSAQDLMSANRKLVGSVSSQEALLGQSNANSLAAIEQKQQEFAAQSDAQYQSDLGALTNLNNLYGRTALKTIGPHLSTVMGDNPNIKTSPLGVTSKPNLAREALTGR